MRGHSYDCLLLILICCWIMIDIFVIWYMSLYWLLICCHWTHTLIILTGCGFNFLLICQLLTLRSCGFFMSFPFSLFQLEEFWGCQFLIWRRMNCFQMAGMFAWECHRQGNLSWFLVMIWWDYQSFV